MSDEESSNYYDGYSDDENIEDLNNLMEKKNDIIRFLHSSKEKLAKMKLDIADQKGKIKAAKEEVEVLKKKRKRDKEMLEQFRKETIEKYLEKKDEIIDLKRKLKNNLDLKQIK